MKTKWMGFTSLAALSVGSLFAQPVPPTPERPDEAPPPERKMERRMFKRHPGPGAGMEKEKVTFLGVISEPAGETVAAQLGLPMGVGLVVREVEKDAPAGSALKEHDVLVKFDDQWLIDPHQFSVLVRNKKEGDEVTLTYWRGGKQANARVKLGTHEVPKGDVMFFRRGPGEMGAMPPLGMQGHQDMQNVMRLMHGGPGPQMRVLRMKEGPARRAMAVNAGNSNVVISDDAGTIELTTKDGGKSVVAKSPKGDVTFSGPINTPEERAKMPEELQKRLAEMEHFDQFEFRLGDDVEVESVEPQPSGVRMLVPRTAPGTWTL